MRQDIEKLIQTWRNEAELLHVLIEEDAGRNPDFCDEWLSRADQLEACADELEDTLQPQREVE